jgi:response regulator RpfG family c-di-GMP phosphodiesterase
MSDLNQARAGVEVLVCAMLDQFNPHLGAHGRRVATLVETLASYVNIQDGALVDLRNAALFHDIGMIGIERRKLFTPFAQLSESDRGLIRLHADFGAAQLNVLPWLQPAALAVAAHHERWDGSGYPAKLRGEAIPFAARVLTVCDAYDEMMNKPADAPIRFTKDEVVDHLLAERGRHYDPRVVETFLTMIERLDRETASSGPTEAALCVSQLRAGHRLARDLLNAEGMTMLARGTVLRDTHIMRLESMRDSRAIVEPIYVEP